MAKKNETNQEKYKARIRSSWNPVPWLLAPHLASCSSKDHSIQDLYKFSRQRPHSNKRWQEYISRNPGIKTDFRSTGTDLE